MHQRPHSIPFAIALFIIAIVALPTSTSAQDREAVRRELIDAMRSHVKHRRFDLAFGAATAALAIKADRETLCSAGMIASRLERFPETAELLSECVRLTTEPTDDQDEIQKRLTHASMLEMARARVGTLHIVAPSLATITVNHRRIGLAPIDQDVFVHANTTIEIIADNFDGVGSEHVTIAPGQRKTVIVRTHPRPKKTVSKPVLSLPPQPSQAAPKALPDRTAFWISAGLTIGAAGSALNFGYFSALDLANADKRLKAAQRGYPHACRSKVTPDCNEFAELKNRGRSFGDIAIASGISTGIGIALSLALWKYAPIKPAPNGIGIAF